MIIVGSSKEIRNRREGSDGETCINGTLKR